MEDVGIVDDCCSALSAVGICPPSVPSAGVAFTGYHTFARYQGGFFSMEARALKWSGMVQAVALAHGLQLLSGPEARSEAA